jgi:hypothetical protein
MKTTIIIEDAAPTVASHETARPDAAAGGPPVAAPGEAIDAGAAPGAGGSTPAGESGNDGGTPPGWLVDAIAAAGGVTAPPSPQGIHLGANGASAQDAGAAPAG